MKRSPLDQRALRCPHYPMSIIFGLDLAKVTELMK